jgi:hypothetical protein
MRIAQDIPAALRLVFEVVRAGAEKPFCRSTGWASLSSRVRASPKMRRSNRYLTPPPPEAISLAQYALAMKYAT